LTPGEPVANTTKPESAVVFAIDASSSADKTPTRRPINIRLENLQSPSDVDDADMTAAPQDPEVVDDMPPR